MSPFILEVSDHAKKRIKQRGITRFQVRRCIAQGRLAGIDLNGRKAQRIKIGKRTLEVIAIEISGGYLLVTAFWRGES